jgi:hypothetical protein
VAHFYTSSGISTKDTNGLYVIPTNATAYETWSFTKPAAAA